MHGVAQRWASRVLERLLPEDMAHALVGDLLEEHALRVRVDGARAAAGWFWAQVGRSVVPALHTAFRRRDWVLAWAVGFVAYTFAASAELSARDSVAMVATHTAVDAIPVLIIYLGAIVLTAYVAERVRAGAALALGLLVTLTAVLQLVTGAHDMPLWYRCALLIAGPAAALAGRKLFARWSRGARASRRRRTVA